MVKRESSWKRKFQVAVSGLRWAIVDQNSFHVHAVVAVMVISLAAVLRLAPWQWTALVIAIGGVFSAELLNTAIEQVVAVLHPEHDDRIGRALDVSAAGVLVAAMAAIVIGLIVFVPELLAIVRLRSV